MLALAPYTVAVGVTAFHENGHKGRYWIATNASPMQEFAICTFLRMYGMAAILHATLLKYRRVAEGQALFHEAVVATDVSPTAAAHDPCLICLTSQPDSMQEGTR